MSNEAKEEVYIHVNKHLFHAVLLLLGLCIGMAFQTYRYEKVWIHEVLRRPVKVEIVIPHQQGERGWHN